MNNRDERYKDGDPEIGQTDKTPEMGIMPGLQDIGSETGEGEQEPGIEIVNAVIEKIEHGEDEDAERERIINDIIHKNEKPTIH